MTGAEILAQVREWVIALEEAEIAEGSLEILDGCVLLTAPEAKATSEALREGLTYADACDTWPQGPHEKADHEGHKQEIRDALAIIK
jgi:hypothetical protein